MRKLLIEDIKGGVFAREWSDEQKTGSRRLAQLKEKAFSSAMSKAESEVIPIVQKAHSL
jgi:ketol-acid reductoisomerase